LHPVITMPAQEMTSSVSAMRCESARGSVQLLRRIVTETDGQDLIEYALVTTFIGFAGAAAWSAIQIGLGNAYQGFNQGVWNLWEPADPAGVI
jgi:Flp pilus assembly pilin Flp